MDQINQQNQITPEKAPENKPKNTSIEHKKVGPIVATLIIVLILIIAALYLFASRINQQSLPFDSNSSYQSSSTTDVTMVKTITNSSDDLQSIQNDLDNSISGIDSENTQ